MEEKIKKFIESDDPLSEDVTSFLINSGEETDLVDFKLTFIDTPSVTIHWITDNIFVYL